MAARTAPPALRLLRLALVLLLLLVRLVALLEVRSRPSALHVIRVPLRRLDRRLGFAQPLPINVREEGVTLGAVDVHALRVLPREQLADERRRGLAQRVDDGHVELARDDILEDVLGGFVVKGWLADEELVGDDTERPQVERVCHPLVYEHLGREVIGRAHTLPAAKPARDHLRAAVDAHVARARSVGEAGDGGGRGLRVGPIDRVAMVCGAQPKVGELDVPVLADEHVLRLEVAHDHALRMQIGEALDRLREVEGGEVLLEEAELLEERVAVAARHILHHHVHVRLGREGEEELHDRRRLRRREDQPLELHVGERVRLAQVRLGQRLDRDQVLGRAPPRQVDGAVSARSEHIDNVKVLHRHLVRDAGRTRLGPALARRVVDGEHVPADGQLAARQPAHLLPQGHDGG
mmetsp:Transcript_9077/g.28558  ORF Transcript_9077/g.28558 Transcript_9077/m.28558 type:complete len:408 (+) Transcript_9077:201-1424(+)